MSCDWDVFCVDCDDRLGLSDWNNELTDVRALVVNAPLLASSSTIATIGLEITHRQRTIDVAWFRKHAGHRLVARDEYGGFDGECGAFFPCGECGRSQVCCKPEGHDDPHSAKKEHRS